MHQTLYRKYRPTVFADVCGQDTTTAILRGQIANGKISHAYLFCGSRGTGKTTCAKILAKAINCTSPVNGDPCGKCEACLAVDSGLTLDISEIDAASNNSVDNIRDLIEQISYPPSELRHRVYIIDEVHMLSTSAFNALLKTLEEPPAHAVFILATTELHKLPATIVSRCQRYDFGRIDPSVIASRLRYIADAEGIEADDDALFLMGRLALGGMRDAIGYLELCSGIGEPLNEKNTSKLLGTTDYDSIISLIENIASKKIDDVFKGFDIVCRSSNDISVLWLELISAYRDLLVVKVTDSNKLVKATQSHYKRLKGCCARFSRELLASHISLMNDAMYLMQKNTAQKRIIAEMTLIKLCDTKLNSDTDSLVARIGAVEDKLTLLTVKGLPTAAPSEPFISPEDEVLQDNPQIIPEERPTAVQSAQEKKNLRILKCWKEIAEKIQSQEPIAGSFLHACKAYECEQDGRLHIIASGNYYYESAVGIKEIIDNAVCAVLGGKYSPSDIIIETCDSPDEYNIFDELDESSD